MFQALGGVLLTLQIDQSRMEVFFGELHPFSATKKPSWIAGVEVLADVDLRGDLVRELAYRNHRSIKLFSDAIEEEVTRNVTTAELSFSLAQALGIFNKPVSLLGAI